VLSGQLIVTSDGRLVHQTAGLEHLLRMLAGERGDYTRYVAASESLPAPVLELLRQITGAADGTSNTPPRMRISTAFGVLTLEAKWLMPAGTLPADAARDPKSCLIAVTIALHEHPIAHAARVLRESGATPTQTKVGIQLALGKPKSVIADELGVQLSSVMATTKKLYQNLDVHNSVELGTRIWLDQSKTRRANICGALDKPPCCAGPPLGGYTRIARIDCRETASSAPPVQGEPLVLLVWLHGNAGGTDWGGRAFEDRVLPRAQARERDDRGHAGAARDHSHGCSRLGLIAPDATMTEAYSEYSGTGALFRERLCSSWMIHRPWHLYGALCFAPWASVGRCTGRGALTWKALTGNWRHRSIPAGFWTR